MEYQIIDWDLLVAWLKTHPEIITETKTEDSLTVITVFMKQCNIEIEKREFVVYGSNKQYQYAKFYAKPHRYKDRKANIRYGEKILLDFLFRLPPTLQCKDHDVALSSKETSFGTGFPNSIQVTWLHFNPIPVLTFAFQDSWITMYYDERFDKLFINKGDKPSSVIVEFRNTFVTKDQIWFCVAKRSSKQDVFRLVDHTQQLIVSNLYANEYFPITKAKDQADIEIYEGWEHLFIPNHTFEKNEWVRYEQKLYQIVKEERESAVIRRYELQSYSFKENVEFTVPVDALEKIELRSIEPTILLYREHNTFYLAHQEQEDSLDNNNLLIAYRIAPNDKGELFTYQVVIKKSQAIQFPVGYESLIETKEYQLAEKFLRAIRRDKDSSIHELDRDETRTTLNDRIILLALFIIMDKDHFLTEVTTNTLVRFSSDSINQLVKKMNQKGDK